MARFVAVVSFFLLLVSFLLAAFAQPTQSPILPTPPQRDPAALATITQAVVAMGAQATAMQVNTVQITGSINPIAASSSNFPAGTFTWTVEIKNPGYEFRHQLQSGSDTSIPAPIG